MVGADQKLYYADMTGNLGRVDWFCGSRKMAPGYTFTNLTTIDPAAQTFTVLDGTLWVTGTWGSPTLCAQPIFS